jgi:hypothetical protein
MRNYIYCCSIVWDKVKTACRLVVLKINVKQRTDWEGGGGCFQEDYEHWDALKGGKIDYHSHEGCAQMSQSTIASPIFYSKCSKYTYLFGFIFRDFRLQNTNISHFKGCRITCILTHLCGFVKDSV